MEYLAPQFRWAPSPSAHAHHHPSSSSRCSGLRARLCAITSDAGRMNGCCGKTLGLAYAASDSAPAPKEEDTADLIAETVEEILSTLSMKGTLSMREKQVVGLRFGLVDGRVRSLQEIGEMMGVCRERIRQIESRALQKLSQKMETHGIMGDEGELDDNAQYTENKL